MEPDRSGNFVKDEDLTPGLYLCGTPIGNLEDISFRALRVLREVDLIAAEDTRHTRKLLSHYDIHTPLVSYNEYNRERRGWELVGKVKEGQRVALVSDAGMPGISDPGQDLVRLAVSEGIPVVVIPGPSALLLALAASGLSTKSFVFEGFPPREGRKRKEWLKRLSGETRTIVLYESPRRLLKTLEDLLGCFGERKASLLREGTKIFEENLRGTLPEMLALLRERPEMKGECTVVVEGASEEEKEPVSEDPAELLKILISQGFSRRDAVARAAGLTGLSRNELYKIALSLP